MRDTKSWHQQHWDIFLSSTEIQWRHLLTSWKMNKWAYSVSLKDRYCLVTDGVLQVPGVKILPRLYTCLHRGSRTGSGMLSCSTRHWPCRNIATNFGVSQYKEPVSTRCTPRTGDGTQCFAETSGLDAQKGANWWSMNRPKRSTLLASYLYLTIDFS